TVVASMRHPQDRRGDRDALLRALARLWVTGVPIDWAAYAGAERRRKVCLPTYPFERQRYWIGEHAEPRQDFARPDRLDRFVAPEGPLQARVAAIWRDVIGIEQIGGSDDFFELGGSSLTATQVVARLGDAFDLDVPIAMLFERTTVAALADGIEELLLDKIEALPEDEL
ncbi:MAG: phosphopantetheine-binding protein, partial [Pseudonocardiaceae bacterium]